MLYLWGIYVDSVLVFNQAFQKVYGLGKYRSFLIVNYLGLHPQGKAKDFPAGHRLEIKYLMESKLWKTGDPLRQEIFRHINNLQEMHSYRGLRHRQCLPSRGQRTHANARTLKNRRNDK